MNVFNKLRKLIDEAEALANDTATKAKTNETFTSTLDALNKQVEKVSATSKAATGIGVRALQLTKIKTVDWDELITLKEMEETDPTRAMVISFALQSAGVYTKDELFEFLSKHPPAADDYIKRPFKL